MKTEQLQKALIIKEMRKRSILNDSLELQNKRKKWLDWLSRRGFNPDFFVCEKYRTETENLNGKKEIYQYFNPKHNTRTKINQETCAEIDKLNFDESMKISCTIIQSLIHNQIHFAVFYAVGQRSPHIRIYDFFELNNLTPMQRELAQAQFWRKITPWAFHYLDHTIWTDQHNLPLEFAPHWKYSTPFDLILEVIPNAKTRN